MSEAGGLALLWGLSALVLCLAAQLVFQGRQRRELRDWLADPARREIPDGRGPWREIYSRLQRLRKEEQKERHVLANSLEHFRLAAQALPDGVILLDDLGHIDWLNLAACQHFSLSPQRDIGTLVGQLIRQSEFHAYLNAYLSRANCSNTSDSILLRVAGNGTERVFSVMLIPFSDAGILLLSRDVTELAQTEIIRRDFVANVSHELRTPLTVISGFLEQFASDTPPAGAAAQTFLRLMIEQSNRMNRLVADLLTLSRLENDSQPPGDLIVDVPALVDDLLSEAHALSRGRHRLVTGEIAPIKLRGSPEEIRSAFGNLLSNAVRYTPAGGTVSIAWRAEHDKAVFSVSDTGIGIPKEHLPRLTERFYRVDKGRSADSGGTGLGLAIVKHVVARHGGSLSITSEIGQGSVFSAAFPRERLHLQHQAPE